MRSVQLTLLTLAGLLSTACDNHIDMTPPTMVTRSDSSSTNGNPTPTPSATLPSSALGKNALPVTVGSCGAATYFNEPCVSVTICVPGTQTCQTIPNILLDTGSFGLRVFSSAVTLTLPSITNNLGQSLAECAQFVTGSDWGPVKQADVVLGQMPAARVNIQIIDSTFASVPSTCRNPDVSPATTGFNGILGVGLLTEDCGPGCATIANNQLYFACTGATCTGTTVPVAVQVSNPVAFLPTDNNGVVLKMAPLLNHAARTSSGTLFIGIGTQPNNTPPAGTQRFPTDADGYIRTTFGGTTYSLSFIDSGSNTMGFPKPANLPACTLSADFYCPAAETSFTATIAGIGAGSSNITFMVGNFDQRYNSGARAADDTGTNFAGAFDWGLPFFFGRDVYFGIAGKSSPTLGVGPYYGF